MLFYLLSYITDYNVPLILNMNTLFLSKMAYEDVD